MRYALLLILLSCREPISSTQVQQEPDSRQELLLKINELNNTIIHYYKSGHVICWFGVVSIDSITGAPAFQLGLAENKENCASST